MRSSHAIVLASPVRTAIGTFGGALKDVPATDLGAAAIKATVERAGLKPEDVATVVMGNVVQAGNKMNPARQAAVHAGLPVTAPALTVNSRNSDRRRGGFRVQWQCRHTSPGGQRISQNSLPFAFGRGVPLACPRKRWPLPQRGHFVGLSKRY